jgi:hypothetical protein
MTKQEAIQELEDEIMDTFEFSKVVSCMRYFNWTWHTCETKGDIPTEFEVRREARRLIRTAAKEQISIGSGGLHVDYRSGFCDVENKPFICIDLSFKIEQSLNDGICYDEPVSH